MCEMGKSYFVRGIKLYTERRSLSLHRWEFDCVLLHSSMRLLLWASIALALLLPSSSLAPANSQQEPACVPALFVFGDSYADTGNHDRHDPRLYGSWRKPYGITWPGYPFGRFSNGKVLTDFVASILNLPSPLPYRERGLHPELVTKGMNFAFGGSGVFETFGPEYPTIEAQIDQLTEIVQTSGSFTTDYLAKSVVLLVYGGNDYAAYVSKHRDVKGIVSFIEDVVDQIDEAIKKIHRLGFRRLLVTNLEPAGCLPRSTFTNSFISCNKEYNVLASYHNKLLKGKVLALQDLPGYKIYILNQYTTFLQALNASKSGTGTNKLQPCCLGVGNFSCGASDVDGRPLFTVCSSPEEAFFWDNVHPTQAGWESVTEFYKSDIISLFGSSTGPFSHDHESSCNLSRLPNQTSR